MATYIADNETAVRHSKPTAAPTSKIASPSDVTLKVDDLSVADDVTITGTLTNAEAGGNLVAKGLTISDGGAVTQATSISTGVTLNTTTGQITTVTGPSIAAGAETAFTVTNSTVAVTSVVVVCVKTQFTDGEVIAYVKSIAAGSFVIGLTNVGAAAVSAGTAIINFAVFGGSAS